MATEYKICTRCVMDTSDPDITFDKQGICIHCRQYEKQIKKIVGPEESKKYRLDQLVSQIKKDGRNKKYDSIIGVSGGVDSTYLAYKVKELGLRPLAIHLDNGWDSELAVKNIENILKRLNIDLYTYVIDWQEFKSLQLAFLKSSTPDSEIPTDHAIFSLMYQTASQRNIKYIISGINTSTESILPRAWSHGHFDWMYIRAIHNKFGNTKLKTFPHYTFFQFLYYLYFKNIKMIFLLDYLPYIKKDAVKLIEKELGWRNYGGKHYESIYTRFFQGYILPKKFGYDKRKAHYSTLINSGQMTRQEALSELTKDIYPPGQLQEDKEFVQKKLDLTPKAFDEIMNLPRKKFSDYPSYENHVLYKTISKIARFTRKLINQ